MSDIITTAAVHAFMQSADTAEMRDNVGLGQAATPQFSGLALTGNVTFPSGPVSIGESDNGISSAYLGVDGIEMSDSGGTLRITSEPDSETHNGGMIDYGLLAESTRNALQSSARTGAICNTQRSFAVRPQLYDGLIWHDFMTAAGFMMQDSPVSPANPKEAMFTYVNDTTVRLTLRGNDSILRSIDFTVS